MAETGGDKGFLGMSKKTQKWVGITLLAGGSALAIYAVVKHSKKSEKSGKALNGVKKSNKRIGKHTSSKKAKKGKKRSTYRIKGF